jgi:hypothetical protein
LEPLGVEAVPLEVVADPLEVGAEPFGAALPEAFDCVL